MDQDKENKEKCGVFLIMDTFSGRVGARKGVHINRHSAI